MTINPFNFSTVGGDGVTESALSTGASFTCLDPDERLTSGPYSPGSKYRGR